MKLTYVGVVLGDLKNIEVPDSGEPDYVPN